MAKKTARKKVGREVDRWHEVGGCHQFFFEKKKRKVELKGKGGRCIQGRKPQCIFFNIIFNGLLHQENLWRKFKEAEEERKRESLIELERAKRERERA